MFIATFLLAGNFLFCQKGLLLHLRIWSFREYVLYLKLQGVSPCQSFRISMVLCLSLSKLMSTSSDNMTKQMAWLQDAPIVPIEFA